MADLVPDHRIAVDLPEVSDVAALPDNYFLIVSDKKSRAAVVGRDGLTSFIELEGIAAKKTGLEAAAYDRLTGRLHVFSEELRTLYTYQWAADATKDPVLESELELSFGTRKNKGVEGLVHLAAASSPTRRPALLLANEGNPRALMLMDSDARDPAGALAIDLDDRIAEACADFSGLAFDARTARLLVVSDESSSIAELSLSAAGSGGIRATTHAVHELRDERGAALDRVEGVTVDDEGRWWVLLEDARELIRVRRN